MAPGCRLIVLNHSFLKGGGGVYLIFPRECTAGAEEQKRKLYVIHQSLAKTSGAASSTSERKSNITRRPTGAEDQGRKEGRMRARDTRESPKEKKRKRHKETQKPKIFTSRRAHQKPQSKTPKPKKEMHVLNYRTEDPK